MTFHLTFIIYLYFVDLSIRNWLEQTICSCFSKRYLGYHYTCQPILYCMQGLKEITCRPDPKRSSRIIVTDFVTTRLVMVEVMDELASLVMISMLHGRYGGMHADM
jgi:hypothetical protein